MNVSFVILVALISSLLTLSVANYHKPMLAAVYKSVITAEEVEHEHTGTIPKNVKIPPMDLEHLHTKEATKHNIDGDIGNRKNEVKDILLSDNTDKKTKLDKSEDFRIPVMEDKYLETHQGNDLVRLNILAVTSMDALHDYTDVIILPSIKSFGIQLRRAHDFSAVDAVTEAELLKGTINIDRNLIHLFTAMDFYLSMTNYSCVAMHRFKGYEGEPKQIISVNLGNSRFTHMINPVIVGNSVTTKSARLHSEICNSEVEITASVDIIIGYKTTNVLLNMYKNVGDIKDKIIDYHSNFKGDVALCVQLVITEMEGKIGCISPKSY